MANAEDPGIGRDVGPDEDTDGLATAVLGGGCFWCLEGVYQQVKGVTEVVSGYAGGDHPDPDYRLVCGGTTGHAEVVRIRYDPAVISYRQILEIFFTIHDPTTPNRQGADVGTQYRSIILHETDAEREIAKRTVDEIEQEGRWPDPVVTQIQPLDRFHPAEPEHQDFYRRNPGQPYCGVVITPKLAKARAALGPFFQDASNNP